MSDNRAKRATRQDVALAAGVSGATVSRVYNYPDLVDRATADRVRACAESLGFLPDKNAAALRRQSSGLLLFVEIENPGYHWPSHRAFQSLYGEIIRAVLHASQQSPYFLRLVSLGSVEEIPGLVRSGDFAGILGFDVTDPQVAGALADLGRPVVCAHHGGPMDRVSTVTTDNSLGGQFQARHLKDRGHRSVAYVTGMREALRSHRLRWEGFQREMVPTVCLDGYVGFAEGQEAGRILAPDLKSGKITAVACVNDLTALGLVQGLAKEGIRAPEEAAVIGYDNLVFTELMGPGLPTIDARLPLVYTRALELLGNLIGGRGTEQHLVVDPVLVSS